ncbi:MAG: AAA family ATPase [Actinobacteria bacterium]|nr:AAA family ATPase [Actinomycetota bacterium]
MQLRSQYSIYDGLYGAKGAPLPEDAFAEHLDELIVRHDLGFDVLTAPRDPSLADYVGARDADRVFDTVIPRYDVVVIDTPPALNEVVLTALDRSDLVVVMATLDVPSLKNLRVFLDTVTRLKIDDSRLRLVLNKIDSDVGLDVKQAQETFSDRFVGLISQSRAIMRAMNMGTVVIESEPRHAVARELLKAVGDVLPEDLAAEVKAATPNSDRGGLLSRLLSKKGDQG